MEDLNALKARAYDLIALIQQAQNELNQVNQQIVQAIQAAAQENSAAPAEKEN